MKIARTGNQKSILRVTDSMSLNLLLEEFEKEIAEYNGTKYAVLCSSGRTAILLSLSALRIGHADEIVVPDFVDPIVAITVFCNGSVPRFCDVDRQTLALSPTSLLETLGPRTKAVIFVHPFGFPTDPSPMLEIANEKGIAFIDDTAQSLGASTRGKKAGSFGNVGILTFKSF